MLGKLLLPRGRTRLERPSTRRVAVLIAAAMTSGCTVVTNFDEKPADAAPTDAPPPADAFSLSAASCAAGEPDNTAGDAQNLTPGQAVNAAICVSDLDFYQFNADAGQRIGITMTFDHRMGSGDLNLVLYYLTPPGPSDSDAGPPADAGSGQQQVGDSDGVGDTEQIMITAANSGTYVLEVAPFSSAQSEYELTLTLQ